MILRVQSFKIVNPTTVWIEFNNGTAGDVDLEPLLDDGPVFRPLRNPEFFRQAMLDPVCGTLVWPNGADFAPEALSDHIMVTSSLQ